MVVGGRDILPAIYIILIQLQKSLCVIPSKDGIQYFQDILDPGFMNMKLRFRRGELNKRVLQ